MKRPLLFLALAAVATVAAAAFGVAAPVAPADAAPTVVRVGDLTVTADEFRVRLGAFLRQTGQADGPAIRQAFLERLVNHRLLVHDALDAGLDATDAYHAEAAAIEEKLLVEALFARVVYDTVAVTDADLRALFARVNTTLEARHLYARTREAADALAARLAAGEAFEALAAETFADPVLAANGGAVGPFTFDEMDAAFEDAAFALAVGETSAPVRTAHGYSIIRLDARHTQPVVTEADFATRRAQFARYARSRQEAAARRALARTFEERLAPRFHDDALGRLLDTITGRRLADEGDAWLAAPLVTFGEAERTTWTAADVRDRAARTDEAQRAAVRTQADLEAFVTGLVVRDALLAEARRHGLDREADFAQARAQALTDWLHARARDRVVASAVVPEDTARAYFDAEADRFALPERVRVHEILAETKAALDALPLADTPFETLARLHSLRPGADANGGDLGYLDRAALGRLADPVFAAEAGTLLGPLEVGGRYVLLQVGDREASRPRTFEEARADVEGVLLRDAREAALRDHLAALRARYRVEVDAVAAAAVRLTS